MDIASAIRGKEAELAQLSSMRAFSLEASTVEKDRSLLAERARYAKLKEDFQYNLALLDDRDKELQELEVQVATQSGIIANQSTEIAALKAEVDRLRSEQAAQMDIAAADARRAQARAAEDLRVSNQSTTAQIAALTAEIERWKSDAHEKAIAVKSLQAAKVDVESQLQSFAELEGLEKLKQTLLFEHETRSSETLAQLRAAQEAFDEQQRVFDRRLIDVSSQKEREAKEVITAMQTELRDLDAKFNSSQEALIAVKQQLKRAQQEAVSTTETRDKQRLADAMKISELSQELQRSESDVKALVGQLEVTRSELDAALSQLEKCEGDLESERQRHLISVNQSASLETELKLKLEKTANALAVANSDISSLKSKNSSLTEQVNLLVRSSQDDRVRLEGLAARSKDAERLAAELATTKLQLQSTSSLLKDARTELRVATVGPHPVMEFTRSQPSRLNASADHGFLSVAEVDRVYPSYHERSYQQPLVASRQDDLSSLQRRLETASGRLQRLSEERARATDASHWSAQDYRAPLDMYSSRAEVYDATVKSPAFLRSSLRERLSTYGLP